MRRLYAGLVMVAAVACGGGTGATPDAGPQDYVVDDWCPGQPHCPAGGEAQLHVGVAVESINPTLVETEWDDADGDGEFDGTRETFTDTNGNGKFDATWIAGFGTGRPAIGFHDDLEARALALRYGDVTVVLVYLDVVGLFIDEVERIKADPAVTALDVDHIVVGASHSHESFDTIGIWGKTPLDCGVDRAHMANLRARTAQAIVKAVQAMKPATMIVAQVKTVDGEGSTLDYVSDTRDPVIYDPTLTLLRFVEKTDPSKTIATLVNWAAHAEYTGSRSNHLSADFPHWLRKTLEDGLPDEGIAGLGGTAVFVQGPLGGQVGPGRAHPVGPDGPISQSGFDKAEWAGKNVAKLGLAALEGGATVEDAPLSYRTAEIWARVDNVGYHAFFITKVLDRLLHRYDTTQPIDETNVPWLRSRISYLQIGPVAAITCPGELHPELWVGGYDGSWSFGNPILTETENAPDLGQAPAGPYLRDLMLGNPGVEYTFALGLAHDFIGYVVADFNYVLNPDAPYIVDADGDHYEETNSIGAKVEEQIQHPMMELARFRPPAE